MEDLEMNKASMTSTDSFPMTSRSRSVLYMAPLTGVVLYLLFIPLLGIVPFLLPVDADILSAATLDGFNNGAAYYVTLAWSVVVAGSFAALERWGLITGRGSSVSLHSQAPPQERGFYTVIVSLVVFTAFVFLYNPIFLSYQAPYIEDYYFLNALHRMNYGQKPFADFEFVYGPLMLYPAYYWTKIFGYSMTSYYSYLALLEGFQFAVLYMVLARFYPEKGKRLWAFIILAIFLLNTLLGLNYNGLRKLLPVFILLLITARPGSVATIMASSILTGAQLAYSLDFGAALIVSIAAMYLFMTVKEKDPRWLIRMGAMSALSILAWFLITLLLLGSAFPSYVQETVYITKRFSSGVGGFSFYWTLNSLAIFGLLLLSSAIAGSGVARDWRRKPAGGDLLFFAGLVYALVALKSGLNRCDFWHLMPPLLVLIFTFILPVRREIFVWTGRAGKTATALILVIAGTYLLGLAPTGNYYARGLVGGMREALSGEERETVVIKTPTYSLEAKKRHPNKEVLRLAEYLAEPSNTNRPVFLYYEIWTLGMDLGICRTDYLTHEFLVSDERGEEARKYLQERSDAIVIMSRPVYERLYGLSDPTEFPEFEERYKPTITKALAGWLSTVHYKGMEKELLIREMQWKKTVGEFVRDNYSIAAEFGRYLVLIRTT